ncbi:MAG: sugar transferase [Acutalibacteraceae bacterium]
MELDLRSVAVDEEYQIRKEQGTENEVKIQRKSKLLYRFIKRAFDVVSTSVVLILFSPVFLIVSILIKADDKGPVIFKHNRIGKNGKAFGVYKFRSMKDGADKVENFLTPEQLEEYRKEFKLDNDPRITKIGNFLRKTSLDELPQLMNILKGEMSVIGPRPIIENEFKYYTEDEKALILSLKPGLTGYWQAYARNDATYETGERQEMELYYAENASVWLDIKILFKSVVSVVCRKGAK